VVSARGGSWSGHCLALLLLVAKLSHLGVDADVYLAAYTDLRTMVDRRGYRAFRRVLFHPVSLHRPSLF
jgi:hypothetical protein